MKKAILLITIVLTFNFQLLTFNSFAQAPQKITYQTVIRNNSNALIVSTNVGIRISILQGSSTGTVVYVETQTALTNINGLASLEIGSGTIVSGSFAGIDWSAGPYFIKTETDPIGGTNYGIVGTSEFLSVPYALYSANGSAGSLSAGASVGNTVYWDGSQWVLNSNTIYNTGTSVGIGTGVILAASAKLEVSSSTQGTLITRMTTTQRDAIVSPAQSLLIYNITTKCFEFWENGIWQSFRCACTPPAQPGAITGATSVCQGNNGVAYSVANVAGVTYTWAYSGSGYTQTSGGNTNSITADYSGTATSGTLTVTPSNACGNGQVQTFPITITTIPVATFSYSGTPYCSNAGNPSPVFSGGGVAGIFSSTAGLVFVSHATGEVNIAASTASSYTVTNTIAATGGCGIVTATSTITITHLPVATFSYTGSPYCSNAANPSPTYSIGLVPTNTFSSTAGLFFVNSTTGQVNLAASTDGTYTVTNTIPASGGCGTITATGTITITTLPVATFSYVDTPYCSDGANPSPVFSGGGVAGVFTSTAGLVFASSATGQVDLAASTAGTYTVTNTIPASGGCGIVTAMNTITITTLPAATFSYTGTPYCLHASNPIPAFSGAGIAGLFSSTAGLVFVNSTTGQVNLAASTATAGTYTVTNTIPASGGCGIVTATGTITITTLPVATFSYTGTPYCSDASNPSPVFSGGGVAGVFSSTAGLVFVSSTTGQVDIAASTAGTYTVTNTIAASGGCATATATGTITISTLPVATFSYTGASYCLDASNPMPAYSGGGIAGLFSSSAGLTFNSFSTGEVNLATSTAGTYTITNTIPASGGCGIVTATSLLTVTAHPTIANAGIDINPACGQSIATLVGNTPSIGTGMWSIVSGTAIITTPASPTSGVTGLALNSTATLRWTISNAPCTASTDDVVIITTTCVSSCGTQAFMASNMNTGIQVTQATTQTPGQKWCYNDVASNCSTYGGLYQWSSAMNLPGSENSVLHYGSYSPSCDPCGTGGIQGICPAGYHIPTDLEWSRFEYCLETTIAPTGSSSTLANFQSTLGWRGANTAVGPGAKMKEKNPAWDGTNTSNFTALPAGYSNGGSSSYQGTSAYIWSATEANATGAFYRYLFTGFGYSNRNSSTKAGGFSVRCLQD